MLSLATDTGHPSFALSPVPLAHTRPFPSLFQNFLQLTDVEEEEEKEEEEGEISS